MGLESSLRMSLGRLGRRRAGAGRAFEAEGTQPEQRARDRKELDKFEELKGQ